MKLKMKTKKKKKKKMEPLETKKWKVKTHWWYKQQIR